MQAHDRIDLDPAIVHGRPVIRGTHVPLIVVVGSVAGGISFGDSQREYDVIADDLATISRSL